jgi:hypothetical protein
MLTLKAKAMTGLLALSVSGAVLAEGLYRDPNPLLLTTRSVGTAVCLNTMISQDDQPVTASINAQLQAVRGKELSLYINDIKVNSAKPAPSVIVIGDVSFHRGDKINMPSDGWYVCQ